MRRILHPTLLVLALGAMLPLVGAAHDPRPTYRGADVHYDRHDRYGHHDRYDRYGQPRAPRQDLARTYGRDLPAYRRGGGVERGHEQRYDTDGRDHRTVPGRGTRGDAGRARAVAPPVSRVAPPPSASAELCHGRGASKHCHAMQNGAFYTIGRVPAHGHPHVAPGLPLRGASHPMGLDMDSRGTH